MKNQEYYNRKRALRYPNVGDMFGYWKVLSVDDKSKVDSSRHHVIYCECTMCSESFWVKRHSLHNGQSTHCRGCTSTVNYIGVGDVSGDYVARVRSAALKRSLRFEIDPQFLADLFERQGGKCAISGVNISLQRRRKLKTVNQTASIDRIDSSKGYLEANVQWVHKDVNNMKMSLSDEEFIKWCEIIVENNI